MSHDIYDFASVLLDMSLDPSVSLSLYPSADAIINVLNEASTSIDLLSDAVQVIEIQECEE
jgi:hypothetical protein